MRPRLFCRQVAIPNFKHIRVIVSGKVSVIAQERVHVENTGDVIPSRCFKVSRPREAKSAECHVR